MVPFSSSIHNVQGYLQASNANTQYKIAHSSSLCNELEVSTMFSAYFNCFFAFLNALIILALLKVHRYHTTHRHSTTITTTAFTTQKQDVMQFNRSNHYKVIISTA